MTVAVMVVLSAERLTTESACNQCVSHFPQGLAASWLPPPPPTPPDVHANCTPLQLHSSCDLSPLAEEEPELECTQLNHGELGHTRPC